jgi:hypothetical protein
MIHWHTSSDELFERTNNGLPERPIQTAPRWESGRWSRQQDEDHLGGKGIDEFRPQTRVILESAPIGETTFMSLYCSDPTTMSVRSSVPDASGSVSEPTIDKSVALKPDEVHFCRSERSGEGPRRLTSRWRESSA